MAHAARHWKKYLGLAAAAVAAYYGVDMDQVKAAVEAARTVLQ